MNRVLSVDLACCAKDIGLCILEQAGSSRVQVSFLDPCELGLIDPLNGYRTAEALYSYCTRSDILIAVLDGPQAWKSPTSLTSHSRCCERDLNTPGKTGTFGIVKPEAYRRFVEFSISVFGSLVVCGAELAGSAELKITNGRLLALESFPFAAWKRVRIPPLPSKRKCKPEDILDRLAELKKKFELDVEGIPTHDQLQALIAGLVGFAVLRDKKDHYSVVGDPPIFLDGRWVEGFIVCPKIP